MFEDELLILFIAGTGREVGTFWETRGESGYREMCARGPKFAPAGRRGSLELELGTCFLT